MTDNTDAWLKIGGGALLGVLTVVLFGEYVWPLIAAIMGLTGICIAIFLVFDAVMEMERNDERVSRSNSDYHS